MSLDTVLKIGKVFRSSENGLKHFKYMKSCPKDKDNSRIIRLSLPVKEDFSFDFANLNEITNQNIIGSDTKDTKLYYLRFKTSDSDGSPVKYLFGDIFYEIIEGKESSIKTSIVNESSSFQNWNNYIQKELLEKLSKLKIKEQEKKELENSALNYFRVNNDISIFRNNFSEFENEIENILYYGLGIVDTILQNNFKVEQLRDSDALKKNTAKKIFDLIVSEKNGKKKLSKLFKNEMIIWEDIKNYEGEINKLFKIYSNIVYLHFDFSNTGISKKYWYEFEEILSIIEKIFLESFAEKTTHGFVFNKTLYKTLCSGDSKNDIQFPNFEINSKHKSKSFTIDEINDLFYAIDYSKKAIINPTEDVKLIVLPNGENLTAEDYENFQTETQSLVAETTINRKNTASKETDYLLSWFDETSEQDSLVTQFDIIFSKKGGRTSPDTDLIELSGIKKSSLQNIRERISQLSKEIYNKRQTELNLSKNLSSLSISWSLTNVLGSCQTDTNGKVQFKINPKYNSHLLKILPKIYTSNYTEDNLLLPAFIENVEYSIRQGDAKFSFLKYDLEFLLSIQNTLIPKQNFLKIMNSKSYELGRNLGKLAIFLKPDKNGDSPINSFEKEFVGNLSRHIGQLRDVQKFVSYLFEKYALHKEKARYIPAEVRNGQVTKQIEDVLLEIQELTNKIYYDKNECAFGFFTSYFAPYESKKLDSITTEDSSN